jgi:hypothetical protein
MDLHKSLLVVTTTRFSRIQPNDWWMSFRVLETFPHQMHAALSARHLDPNFTDLVATGHSLKWPSPVGVLLQAPLDSQPYGERDWWRGCVS